MAKDKMRRRVEGGFQRLLEHVACLADVVKQGPKQGRALVHALMVGDDYSNVCHVL